LVIIIVVFSLVQSLFGMGLLVFGTPTLLLLGWSFPETLAALLPASVAISLLQATEYRAPPMNFVASFARWCLLPLAASLAGHLWFGFEVPLELLLSAVMLSFAAIRLLPNIRRRVIGLAHRGLASWLMAMGIVHGLTNMGGSLLAIIAASRFDDKRSIRQCIAFCYLCFALVQLGVLAVIMPEVFSLQTPVFCITAAATYAIFGRKLFDLSSAIVFDRSLTAFVFAYAVALGAKGVGVL
jgi:hypothetical protein